MLGMVAGILSVAPSVDSQDYLVKAAANETQVMGAAFSQLIMVAAYVGVAIILYPLLKKYSEGLALGFISFRIIAGAFVFIGVIILLLLLTVSREFVNSGAPGASYFQTLGGLLRTGRDLVNHVGMILALSFGALLYYSLLFRTNLVPRWLSGWGLVGAALAIVASLLIMFRLIEVVTTTYVALNAPMAVQELVLAIWLVTKGFNPSALDAASR
jgi:hypothetical protein